VILKLPASSEDVVIAAARALIVAPESGAPAWFLTEPVIVREFCANRGELKAIAKNIDVIAKSLRCNRKLSFILRFLEMKNFME
jgi:hypothetical protein